MPEEILKTILDTIERGKVDIDSPYPPDMKGKKGAVELTRDALDQGISAQDILMKALMVGMRRVGEKFGCGEAFIPDLMISAKAMTAATALLKPHFESAGNMDKGIFVIGTVSGDLHDIGKNIVKMIMEGAGWKVIDLGTNVSTDKFLAALEENPTACIGLSALLTTTMVNMQETVRKIKNKNPKTPVVIGGAPITDEFSNKIGADAYFPSPHVLPDFLEKTVETKS